MRSADWRKRPDRCLREARGGRGGRPPEAEKTGRGSNEKLGPPRCEGQTGPSLAETGDRVFGPETRQLDDRLLIGRLAGARCRDRRRLLFNVLHGEEENSGSPMLRQVNYSLVEFRLILLLSILHGFPANNWRIYCGARSRVSSASTTLHFFYGAVLYNDMNNKKAFFGGGVETRNRNKPG